MRELIRWGENHFANEKKGFFSLGDNDAQTALKRWGKTLTVNELVLYLKCMTLLYDKVFHSISFPFESGLTLKLYKHEQVLPLFDAGLSLFAVGSDVKKLEDHPEKKRRVTPRTFNAYHSDNYRKVLSELDHVEVVYRRDLEISKIIAKHWRKDLNNGGEESLDKAINVKRPSQAYRLERVLRSVADERGTSQLSPEYVIQRLSKEGFNNRIIQRVLDRLLMFYVQSSAETMHAQPINLRDFAEGRWLSFPKIEKGNIALFVTFIEGLGLKEAIFGMSSKRLAKLREKDEYKEFIDKFNIIVDDAVSIEENFFRLNIARVVEQDNKILKRYIHAVAETALTLAFRVLAPISSLFSIFFPSMLERDLSEVMKKIGNFNTSFETFRELVEKEYVKQMETRFGRIGDK